ncbi:alanine racemase [Paracoccaceae bacterium GXU_MW_L88]
MRATLRIDLAALAANWKALDRLSGPAVETGAVVKADGYGLGMAEVAPVLRGAGARSFFVALAEEAAELRPLIGEDDLIYVLNGYMPGDAAPLKEGRAVPVLVSVEQIDRFKAEMQGYAYGLQIDSGMNRLGLEPQDFAATLTRLPPFQPPRLVMSHLACADQAVHPLNAMQLATFSTLAATFPASTKSLAATGGTMLGAPYHFGLTRPGIGVYGGLPYSNAKPVVAMDLPVLQVRTVLQGEIIGYGATWTAPGRRRIATVSGGYGDGIFRSLSNRGALYAGETRCPIVGRISMDTISVDVTDLGGEVPDTLELIGAHQTLDALAKDAGTIGYEVLTDLGRRYQRAYV